MDVPCVTNGGLGASLNFTVLLAWSFINFRKKVLPNSPPLDSMCLCMQKWIALWEAQLDRVCIQSENNKQKWDFLVACINSMVLKAAEVKDLIVALLLGSFYG